MLNYIRLIMKIILILSKKEVTEMAQCYVTGKKTVFGNSRSHALNATKRTWKANLQTVKIVDEDGNVKRVKVSARALKKSGLVKRA